MGLAGLQQGDAVADGGFAGEFVGEDGASFVVLNEDGGEEAEVFVGAPVEAVGVAHQVEGGGVILPEDAGGAPLPVEPGGVPVAGVGVSRVGLFAAFQVDGVVGAALAEFGFEGAANHIVGGADYLGKGADGFGGVADAAERFDGGHWYGVSGGLRVGGAGRGRGMRGGGGAGARMAMATALAMAG